jgi:hypothetical protein
MLVSGAPYHSMRHVMAGWAAGALLPIAQMVQPLRLLTWQDTLPSGRDLEALLAGALQVGRAPPPSLRPCIAHHSPLLPAAAAQYCTLSD